MLRSLHIRDFVIVEQTELHFDAGFSVFTGETGAGKSILIDALALTLGARGDSGAIREGADKADISAIFDVPGSLRALLAEQELEPEDDQLVLRRVIDRAGKSRAFINGVPGTLGQLKTIGSHLLDIHGQHAHQKLLQRHEQRILLDAHGQHEALAKQVRSQWTDWQQAQQKLERARSSQRDAQAERERLEWQLNEISQINPGKDEWASVNADYNRLANASALLEGASGALNLLDGEQTSALAILNAALHHIEPLLRNDERLQGVHDAIESARIAVTEASSDLASYLDKAELDPDRLAETEARMGAMFATARKFRLEPEKLYDRLQELTQALEALNSESDLEGLEQQVARHEVAYREAAEKLTKARQATAGTLSKEVSKALQTLAMKGSTFEITIQPAEPGASGMDNVLFNVAAHTGSEPRPLAKVASGGELARISLALSVMANRAHQVPTLIYDEVDTGIGGAVAEVVGKLLRDLGRHHQVLCVTHLPQVAACAHHHFEVQKKQGKKETVSRIDLLDDHARTEEIARMLGGVKITETTRQHAREMLTHSD
ncbi:DNA repair protein RecN [Advenella sp. FME57]|uniref:DNA repair protein RecN n=1 Tax=Advenella kashmirensis TaxID=310575 RepID=A0A356LKZ8_9BURK|nr:DNA repair protein RecN [Advenella sp. FME57]HBP31205.1 DNA repair protein RecN [Advenella kashmirensis]